MVGCILDNGPQKAIIFVIVDSGFGLSTVAIINASLESLDLCLYLSPGYFLSLSISLLFILKIKLAEGL